jgi:hypothetical protein
MRRRLGVTEYVPHQTMRFSGGTTHDRHRHELRRDRPVRYHGVGVDARAQNDPPFTYAVLGMGTIGVVGVTPGSDLPSPGGGGTPDVGVVGFAFNSKNPDPVSGQAGDLFVDAETRLWYCHGGTNWKKLT